MGNTIGHLSTGGIAPVPTNTPVRRLVAAGIKRTGQPWLVEQPQMSPADRAARAAASHVRRPAMT